MKNVIEVEKLSKFYNEFSGIKDINISVKRGTTYGLLGANGAGKSTTIECILGAIKSDTCKISILGYYPNIDRKLLFENIGVQFQENCYQREIKVFEICDEISCLYKNPTDWKILLELKNKGLTIFLTSHFMDEIEKLCDEICILNKGKIKFSGTIQDAKKVSGCNKFENAYIMLSGKEI